MSNNGPKSEFNGADETANNKPKASDWPIIIANIPGIFLGFLAGITRS